MNEKLIADLIRIHNDKKFKLGWIEQTILADACAALAPPQAASAPRESGPTYTPSDRLDDVLMDIEQARVHLFGQADNADARRQKLVAEHLHGDMTADSPQAASAPLPTAWRYKYLGQWHLSDEMPGEGASCLTPLFDTPALERSSADWRRLTGLWRYGVAVCPPTCVDFYNWLAVLDAAIDERTNRRG